MRSGNEGDCCCGGEEEGGCCSGCCCSGSRRPYNDGLFLAAQILSIFGFICSWGSGLFPFIVLQCAFCCPVGKCLLLTTAIFSAIVTVAMVTAAPVCHDEILYYTSYYSYDYDSGTNTHHIYKHTDELAETCFYSATIAALLWLATTVCLFVFLCAGGGSRYNQAVAAYKKGLSNNTITGETTEVAAIPMGSATPTRVITYTDLPDGRIEKRVKTVDENGFETVIVSHVDSVPA